MMLLELICCLYVNSYLLGLLLELLDRSLVDTSALVDQVTGGSGLAGIDVTDNDEVDLILLLGHGYG